MTVRELRTLHFEMEQDVEVFLYAGIAAQRVTDWEIRPTGVFHRGEDPDLPGDSGATPNDVFSAEGGCHEGSRIDRSARRLR